MCIRDSSNNDDDEEEGGIFVDVKKKKATRTIETTDTNDAGLRKDVGPADLDFEGEDKIVERKKSDEKFAEGDDRFKDGTEAENTEGGAPGGGVFSKPAFGRNRRK
eukprot:TRINITY_DN8689_c0_g1_i1.p2 TRINITY_DN8689_c0_g1~~TRINITY_DN8689_c0_g1_i1.p2  ORF type:complete len:106 (+),score=40.07 TRINITY_DN8689_c0_g1_i1:64-381(+)